MTYYVGWRIPDYEKNRLLEKFPPIFDNVVAHHITLEYDVSKDIELPEQIYGIIVGHAHDENIEALVVSIDGTITRPDGSFFHITWSMGDGAKAVQSNKLIKDYGFETVAPIMIDLIPELMR